MTAEPTAGPDTTAPDGTEHDGTIRDGTAPDGAGPGDQAPPVPAGAPAPDPVASWTARPDGLWEPDEAARRLYLAILADGGRLRFADVPEDEQEALHRLVDLGLLMANPMDSSYTAVSPRSVSDRLGAELRSEATRLLVRAESLPGALDGLTRAYDAMPRPPERSGGAVYIEGQVHIRHRISQLVSDCREEVLTAQPGHRPPPLLEVAVQQDIGLLQRGCSLRTLYQPIALSERGTIAYAEEVTRRGSRIRVLDEPFQRMIVFDRSVAVISASDDHSAAAFLSDPAAIAFLVGAFERDWARADPVDWFAVARGSARSTPDRVARLLAKGLTQRAVATRLGLSERTVAAHISRLRERYGAETLFQLGWLMRGGRGD